MDNNHNASLILVVDDESDVSSMVSQRFRKRIRTGELTFIFAEDGVDALEKLEIQPHVDMVVSDISMPRMDGLTLISQVKEKYPLIKSVIVSAYGNMDNIRHAMNNGAFDFLTKPLSLKDLESTVNKTLTYVKELKQSVQVLEENNILKMYVDERVIQFQKNKMTISNKCEDLEGAILFIDICGFTSLAEKLAADQVFQSLNQYFNLIAGQVLQYGGIIDKFIW